MEKNSKIRSFANYITILVIGFFILYGLFYFTFLDYSDVKNIIEILITSIITVFALLVAIIFVIVQFAAQRYSPRALAQVILNSIETRIIVVVYLVIICFGLVLLGNKTLISDSRAVDSFFSLTFSILILSLYFLVQLTSMMRPDLIASRFCAIVKRKGKHFISRLIVHYRKDPIRYPVNITAEDDLMVPLFNIIEGALSAHDLASITTTLSGISNLIEYLYLHSEITDEGSNALVQYMGMHLTRLVEMITESHEDDVYQDIFKIQNLLILKNCEKNYFEGYKWCMITYHYMLKFISKDQEESDYSLRTAIHFLFKLVELDGLYAEKQLPFLIDLVNYLARLIPWSTNIGFIEPMEKWLMGMESQRQALLSLHKAVCEKISKSRNISFIQLYLQRLFERLVNDKEFMQDQELDDLLKALLNQLDETMKRSTIHDSIQNFLTIHPTKGTISEFLQRIENNYQAT